MKQADHESNYGRANDEIIMHYNHLVIRNITYLNYDVPGKSPYAYDNLRKW